MRDIIDIDNHPGNIDLAHDLFDCTFKNRFKRLEVMTIVGRKKLIYNENYPYIYDVVFNQDIDLKVL